MEQLVNQDARTFGRILDELRIEYDLTLSQERSCKHWLSRIGVRQQLAPMRTQSGAERYGNRRAFKPEAGSRYFLK